MTGVAFDPFEDRQTLEERKFGRLRELCLTEAWTVENAAWIICGFDRSGHQKGDWRYESDGWLPLRGWSVPQQPPESTSLKGQAQLDQMRERLEERCEADRARYSHIGLIALRLAGLLPGGVRSAHPPARILEVACRNGMVPPWLEYARADSELAAVLPREVGEGKVGPLLGETVEERQAKAAERWLNLVLRLEDGWHVGKSYRSSFRGVAAKYPHWSFMLAFDFYHRDEGPKAVEKRLRSIAGLNLDSSLTFSATTVRGWRSRYERQEDVALAILKFRLLGLEGGRPHENLPHLEVFLDKAERESDPQADSF